MMERKSGWEMVYMHTGLTSKIIIKAFEKIVINISKVNTNWMEIFYNEY